MKDLLELILRDGYSFFGTLTIILILSGVMLTLVHRVLAYFTIRRWGYPPSHCDVKGGSSLSELD